MKTTITSTELGYYVAFHLNAATKAKKLSKNSGSGSKRRKPDAVIVYVQYDAELELVISALKRLTAIMKNRQSPKNKTYEI